MENKKLIAGKENLQMDGVERTASGHATITGDMHHLRSDLETILAVDRMEIERRFRDFLETSFQNKASLSIEGLQDLFRIAQIPISATFYRNLKNGYSFGIKDTEAAQINFLANIWIETLTAFLCKRDAVRLTQSEREALSSILTKRPIDASNVLTSFFAIAEDEEFREIILAMADREGTGDVFREYAQLVQGAMKNAETLYALSKEMNPGTQLTPLDFYRSLVRRGNALLREVDACLWYDQDQSRAFLELQDIITEFRKENAEQSALRSFFHTQASLLSSGKNVSLKNCVDTQTFIAHTFENAHGKSMLLRSLERQGKLAHIPEIFWEVDRRGEDYKRRLGLDMIDLVKEFSKNGAKKSLLEFGPGNGTFAEERAHNSMVADRYTSLGICNKLYYPLTPLIKSVIDWEALERDGAGSMDEKTRGEFADFFYKVLVLKPGTTGSEYPEYDAFVNDDLNANAWSIGIHLKQKAHLLGMTEKVPSVICGRDNDGKVFYPHHIVRPRTPVFENACRLLSQKPEKYIRQNEDVYSLIPAYPPGVMIGDFMDIANLKNKEIDVALGVRSTVYVRGKDYVQFMTEMSRKITDDGFYIDDNVRDNDGWYYRIAELLEARKQIDPSMQIHVILGPALEKEDHMQGAEGVPLAMVMTKDLTKLAYVRRQLARNTPDKRTGASYRLVRLEDLAQQRDYLTTLDATGKTINAVLEAMTQTKRAA